MTSSDGFERNSMDWTPQQAMDDMRKVADADNPDAFFGILLWNQDAQYHTKFVNSGLRVSEAIALLEKVKHELLHYMSGTAEED